MSASESTVSDEATLDYSKHIRYWRRNLKTFLPHHYTGNDSNRMLLGCFILSATDLLGDLNSALSPEERNGYIDWVYSCQLPDGCFRPWPGTDFGTLRNKENEIWDPAHVPGTFFALLTLAILGDDLTRVKRREILVWLNKVQRPDGSFGEALGQDGRVEGGNDTRFGFMTVAIRWILRGHVEGPVDGVPDIDVDKFVKCVQESETYDGGISEAPFHEAHAGFASCAISALYLVDRLPLPPGASDGRVRGITNLPRTLHWLASRQTMTLDEEDEFDTHADETDSAETCHDAHSFVKSTNYSSLSGSEPIRSPFKSHPELQWVGLNGRCNKIADTCYAYWVGAPLKLLGHLDLIDPRPVRRWLLDRTQHIVGGFGKVPGAPPDIYHSYLGLVILSMFGEPGLQNSNAVLCVSSRAIEHLEALPWRKEIVGQ